MSQHDYNLANASGPAFRADANAALQAIVTQNAGPSPPTPTFANQIWYDTSTAILKKRDNSNTTWQNLFRIDSGTIFTLVPGVNSRNAFQVQNAANVTVMGVSVDGDGDGWMHVEDRNGVVRMLAAGRTAGGRIFLDGDETTGKQVAPSLVLGPFGLAGTAGQTVALPLGVTEVSITFAHVSFYDAASIVVQLGTSAGLVGAGGSYAAGSVALTDTGAVFPVQYTQGFIFRMGILNQQAFGISRIMASGSGNVWVESHGGRFSSYTITGGGAIQLPGALTQLRLGGTTFQSGHFSVHVRF